MRRILVRLMKKTDDGALVTVSQQTVDGEEFAAEGAKALFLKILAEYERPELVFIQVQPSEEE